MDVNLKGIYLGLKHQVPHMIAHGGGAIVDTSSGAVTSGRIWTPPDCNRFWQAVVQGSQLLTYIRLRDAAVTIWSSPRASMGFRSLPPQRRRDIGRSHAGPDTGSGRDEVTVSPSSTIRCNCEVRPPFLFARFRCQAP